LFDFLFDDYFRLSKTVSERPSTFNLWRAVPSQGDRMYGASSSQKIFGPSFEIVLVGELTDKLWRRCFGHSR
jgi:hypothetical protein